ncbi:MAG: WYL domain-containing protein [Erysipelotrichales bacterium]|nr:WYL domain-containing protein [Erysipelotrichales bacterium]
MNKTVKPGTALGIYTILRKYSDASHLLTQEMISNRFADLYGRELERKAIARGIGKVRAAGYDVIKVLKSADPLHKGGYYLAGEENLTEAQWKIILSAINAASFVSESEAEEMNVKIAEYVSEGTAKRLRSSSVFHSEKTGNPEVLDTISLLGEAILSSKAVYFRYADYYWKGSPHYHRTDKLRHAVPCAAKWENDRFYMIGYLCEDDVLYPENSGRIEERIFRVDKMENFTVDEEKTYDNTLIDTAHFADQKIGLYAGAKRTVKCAVNERGLGMILDRFGEKTNEVHVISRKNNPEYPLEVSFTVEVSPVFFGFMTTLKNNAKILGPKAVADEYLALAESIRSIYMR